MLPLIHRWDQCIIHRWFKYEWVKHTGCMFFIYKCNLREIRVLKLCCTINSKITVKLKIASIISSIFISRKIWPGVCPILEILSFCLQLLKILEIRKYSKCRFLGKIGQGSALHWCFWFLKFSKCGFLRKFDQGSALYLNSQCLNCLITFWDVLELCSFFFLRVGKILFKSLF